MIPINENTTTHILKLSLKQTVLRIYAEIDQCQMN